MRQVLSAIKAIAGNDDVKDGVVDAGGIELMVMAMNRHMSNAKVLVVRLNLRHAFRLIWKIYINLSSLNYKKKRLYSCLGTHNFPWTLSCDSNSTA